MLRGPTKRMKPVARIDKSRIELPIRFTQELNKPQSGTTADENRVYTKPSTTRKRNR